MILDTRTNYEKTEGSSMMRIHTSVASEKPGNFVEKLSVFFKFNYLPNERVTRNYFLQWLRGSH